MFVSGKDMTTGATQFIDFNSTYTDGLSLGGGAIYCSMCNIISLKSSTFSNNFAKDGGALIISFDLAYEASVSSFSVDQCSFTSNKATLHGGAVYSTEKLDAPFGVNPGLLKVDMQLLSNTFD